MAKEPFPAHGHDGETPPTPGAPAPDPPVPLPEDDWDGEAAIESLVASADAGECDLPPDWLAADEPLPLGGFGHGGMAEAMGPGPVLAALVHAAAGDGASLTALSEDELVGVIAAVRRLESRMAWTAMSAMRELSARRPPARGQAGYGRAKVSGSAADELAMALSQSWQSVVDQIGYACEVAARLPRTFAALAAGLIHPVHVKIIEDETRFLSEQDAAAADEALAAAAQSKSFGELRYAAHRLALKLDPGCVARRKQAARREAHVRRFREDSGNTGMVARELPSAEVLASWQHVEQRALDLRAAGMPGTLRELRVLAYLDLLQERDSRPAPVPAMLGAKPLGDQDLDGAAEQFLPRVPEHKLRLGVDQLDRA